MRALGLLAAALLSAVTPHPPAQQAPSSSDPAAGVPASLAEARAARLSELRYDLSLRLPADRREPIAGHVSITFQLQDPSASLALDFAPGRAGAVKAITAGGVPVVPRLANDH